MLDQPLRLHRRQSVALAAYARGTRYLGAILRPYTPTHHAHGEEYYHISTHHTQFDAVIYTIEP